MRNTHKTVSHGFMLLQREQLTIYFPFFYFFNICTRDISSRLSPSPYDFPYISPVHIQTWPLSKTAPESTRPPPFHKKHVETNERDNTLAEHTIRVTHRRTNSWKSSSARRLPANKWASSNNLETHGIHHIYIQHVFSLNVYTQKRPRPHLR